MKITQIQALAEKAGTEAEKKAILDTLDVFSDTFSAMLRGAPAYMLDQSSEGRPGLSAAAEALRFLRECGARYGMEFPEAHTDGDVAAYVIQFGAEVIRHK